MEKFNVVILASGLSTRLKPITNHLPKCLVNINNKTALMMQYEYWAQYKDLAQFYVVVHSQFKEIVEGYLEVFELSNNIKVITKDESLGSYEAIQDITKRHPELSKNTFYNWSDVIPVSDVEVFGNYGQNIIFTNYGDYRFRVDSWTGINEVDCDGNVPGLYFIRDFSEFTSENINNDDLISHFVNWTTQHIEEIIDFGDLKKLETATRNQVSRDFNKVIIDGNTVEKIALNDQGFKLQQRELAWYSKVTENVPEILVKRPMSFVMSKTPGIEAFKVSVTPQEVLGALSKIHNLEKIEVSSVTLNEDITIEARNKVFDRCHSIQSLIKGFGNIKSVNGVTLLSLYEIVSRLHEKIVNANKNTTKYSVIHGDPNFSNIFIDEGITFIDPRGYFGNTEIYGLPSYDRAKVLYACSGYDMFNHDFSWGGLIKDGPNLVIDIKSYRADYMNSGHLFTKEEYCWLSIIWISLAGYFKNNPIKSIAAYYYGVFLGTRILERYA